MRQTVIVSAVRTPIASLSGALSQVPAVDLGALVVNTERGLHPSKSKK